VHVVVVDDEERLVTLVGGYLAELGIETTPCFDGLSGLEAALRPDVDAVVLDLMLPGISGLEVCRRLRAGGNDVPVLMLTARGTVPERVAGLEAGADDYLVKPFAMEELHARLQAIQRRRPGADEVRLSLGDVSLDPLERRVWITDEEVTLPRREFAMLTSLLRQPGRVISRERLYDEVWSDEVDIRSNALDVHMSRLRGRLAASTEVVITTMRGVGYRLELRSDEARTS
jgi:DNA-binding response OmpR family regulator